MKVLQCATGVQNVEKANFPMEQQRGQGVAEQRGDSRVVEDNDVSLVARDESGMDIIRPTDRKGQTLKW
jgi:hypothetical protein